MPNIDNQGQEVTTQERQSLIEELGRAARRTERFGWTNHVCAHIVAWVAVTGSIAATILAAVQLTPGWLTATVAAIPAAVLAISTTFNFERKALWHWLTTKKLKALSRRLTYERAAVVTVSREFSRVEIETFEGWMTYSALSPQTESKPEPKPEKDKPDDRQH